MNLETYRRTLKQRLCWADGSPTHASSGPQRQCPRCRRKWSYERRRKEWALLLEFCSLRNARQAARRLGVGYSTAWHHFSRFRATASEELRARVQTHPNDFLPATEKGRRLVRQIPRIRNRRKSHQAWNDYLFSQLTYEHRVTLLYELLISPPAYPHTPEAWKPGA